MPTLHETQVAVRDALLAPDGALPHLIADGPIDAATALEIHRTNVFSSLERALAASFPAVQRLVDARFFSYAAAEFVRLHPPCRPCLAEYGAGFADFLAGFPPCRELLYLPDVARLEWRMQRAADAPLAASLAADVLAAVPPERAGALVLALHPSLQLLASAYAVHSIWRASQGEADSVTADGATQLAIWRQGEEVVFRALEPAPFAFLARLAAGAALAAATEAALALDPLFDLPQTLAALFHGALVVGLDFVTATEEEVP